MNLCSIASSSSGNCIYVGNDQTHLLIDAGISMKRMIQGLELIHVEPNKVNGILITHEHSDHIKGLEVMVFKHNIEVYATYETIEVILLNDKKKRLNPSLFHAILPDVPFTINDIEVTPFSISHDARNPVCYTLSSEGHKVGMATDLGKYDDYIISHLAGSEILLLEANHDINMLQVGPYPYMLKRRILGEKGHLSNDNSARLLMALLNDKLRYIFLGHLSKENNYPELAYETVRYELDQGCFAEGASYELCIADKNQPSALVSV